MGQSGPVLPLVLFFFLCAFGAGGGFVPGTFDDTRSGTGADAAAM